MELEDNFTNLRFNSPIRTKQQPRYRRLQTISPSKRSHGDRFICNRNNIDEESKTSLLTPIKNVRVLRFTKKKPEAREERILYKQPVQRKTLQPIKVLDAPGIVDDYYLNLMDWSLTNQVSIALSESVYLWNANHGTVSELLQLEQNVCSLRFIQDGSFLAVGTETEIQLWDVEREKKVRTMQGHSSRVGSLAWNAHILSSGSRSGSIINSDVRIAKHAVSEWNEHEQEVCGLEWSPDGSQLASGSNDNLVKIWEGASSKSVHTLSEHLAAVKAVAWCPWQSKLLATGGGTSDKTVKFWDSVSGNSLSTLHTGSQVTSIKFSKSCKEFITSHGYAENKMCIYKYPNLQLVGDVEGHESRILHTALSPDGTTVCSVAADEVIKFYNCWDKKQVQSRPLRKLKATIR